MKGDFSRSTFDPGKHYSSVRMQQGRVQLDADWNEQADILLHLIVTQLQDLLGPGATAVPEPGFAITLVEPVQEPVDQGQAGLPDEDQAGNSEEPTQPARPPPDFWIGDGRYYVDGILCESEAPVRFSQQPDYPAGPSELQKGVDVDHVLVYLDVWGRHISAAEDPDMREIALGGPDTTTRTQTVWQVKLLPLPGYVADGDDWRERRDLRSLQAWTEFEQKAAEKGQLKAKWENDKGAFPENHLYRVEIHTVADDQITFKWSRENGSVVFPIIEEYLFTWEDVPGSGNEDLLRYLREDLALDWVEGAKISKPDDGPMIRIEKGKDWVEIVLDEGEKTATLTTSDDKRGLLKVTEKNGKRKLYRITNLSVDSGTIELNLEGLERDPYQLSENDWVEIVDDVTVLNGPSLPLCQVKELDRQHGRITLQVDKESTKRILAEIGERELQHPLLRRWEEDAKPMITPEAGTSAVQRETWLDLENGIQVAFSDTGTYQAGDYWLIPARTQLDEGIEWPQANGQPAARPPHGIIHHYDPLALLQFGEGGWSVIGDAATAFHSLPHITANLITIERQLDEVQKTVDTMVKQTHVFQDFNFTPDKTLEEEYMGYVVALDPGQEDTVTLASEDNERLAVGVVTELIDSHRCRVVLYGRVRCRVVGKVEPGDLLVPSPVPGHAQRAGLYLQPGTILGKALNFTRFDPEVVEEIEEGRRPVESGMSQQPGTVDMLVTLG
jgi:hypothetical protein